MCRPPTVLVPLRALGVGKSRLAALLDPQQRAALAEAMFADVLLALSASSVDEVVVAAGNPAAMRAASSRGIDVVADPAGTRSLDAALTAARTAIGPRAALLVLAADLPTLTPDEIDEVVRTDADVVIAPTHDDGTGALLRRPPEVIATAYGAASGSRHRARAQRAGLRHSTVDLPGFRRDVDTWTDLVGLATIQPGPHTAALLPDLLATAAPAD